MEKKYNDAFITKVMKGLNIAVKKVLQEASRNNESIVISKNGKIEHVYPKNSH